jgi:hypothetical protein
MGSFNTFKMGITQPNLLLLILQLPLYPPQIFKHNKDLYIMKILSLGFLKIP